MSTYCINLWLVRQVVPQRRNINDVVSVSMLRGTTTTIARAFSAAAKPSAAKPATKMSLNKKSVDQVQLAGKRVVSDAVTSTRA